MSHILGPRNESWYTFLIGSVVNRALLLISYSCSFLFLRNSVTIKGDRLFHTFQLEESEDCNCE